MKATRTLCLCAALAALAALTGAPTRAADDEAPLPSFKKRGDNEKDWVARVGTAIVKAAHPTAKNIEVLDRMRQKRHELPEHPGGQGESAGGSRSRAFFAANAR